MTALVGGVFGSRLNLKLREELGYTYGAHTALDTRRFAGPFTARTAVHTDVTVPALSEVLAQLELLRDEPAGEKELREVQNFLIGVFPLRFESTGGVAAAIEPLAVYGLDDDYWQTYRANLDAVTPDAVENVARELLRLDEMLCLVVGDASQVEDGLRAAGFGPMEVVSPD